MMILDEKRVDELSADLQFVSDSQDVEGIRDYIAQEDVDEIDAFFVAIEDGDYVEIWGIQGIVPRNGKRAVCLVKRSAEWRGQCV